MPENERKEPMDIGDYYSLINTIIIVLNVIVFVFVDLSHSSMNTEWMLKCGAMYWPFVLEDGEYFRLITSMFLHFGTSHIFNNMLVLWFIGGTLEQLTGHVKYLILYFLSGIFAGLISMGFHVLSGTTPVAAGASGAIFGIVGALLYVVIINHGKAGSLSRKQLFIFVLLTLYSGFTSQGVDNAAHLGGFFSGFILAAIVYRRPRNIDSSKERNPNYYVED